MTHEEILKEADRISESNKHEIQNIAFKYLKMKERENLNNIKVYECQDKLSWYIYDFDDSGESIVYPFGFFFADYFNQLLSLESKESFIAYERRMHSGAKSEKEINPLFDKKGHFCMWSFDAWCQHNKDIFPIDPNTTDNKLGTIYNNVCWLWDYVKDDVNILFENFDYYKNGATPNNRINKIYNYVKRMVLLNWHRQINSYYFNKDSYDLTDEDIEYSEKENQDLISPDFCEKLFVGGFRYTGSELVKFEDNTESFCRVYDVSNLLFLVAEDLLRFMLHQTTHKFNLCPECKRIFVTTHGNQKHCPACKKNVLQKKRRENPYRYMHKKITDFLNVNGSEEKPSEMFLNESNYYWAIVQGKTPKISKENWYHHDIKTKEDYMEWLNKELLRLKKLKKENKL